MEQEKVRSAAGACWASHVLPSLARFVEIPALSPAFDASWQQTPIVITGAAGADSNAHVPDESLNIPFAGQITEAVAYLLDAHARHSGNGAA